MEINKYTRKIIQIIILTNIPLVISIFISNKAWVSYSYILGSVASAGNFIWHSYVVLNALSMNENATKLRVVKGFYLRYVVFVLYAFIIAFVFKNQIDIIWFGFGLLSAQISIYLDTIWNIIKKYLRIE
ncbi:hypothetical protein JEZ13_11320 [bacterium]|nr:hypothetical protein [bacterium]